MTGLAYQQAPARSQSNRAVLHRDPGLMPHSRKVAGCTNMLFTSLAMIMSNGDVFIRVTSSTSMESLSNFSHRNLSQPMRAKVS